MQKTWVQILFDIFPCSYNIGFISSLDRAALFREGTRTVGKWKWFCSPVSLNALSPAGNDVVYMAFYMPSSHDGIAHKTVFIVLRDFSSPDENECTMMVESRPSGRSVTVNMYGRVHKSQAASQWWHNTRALNRRGCARLVFWVDQRRERGSVEKKGEWMKQKKRKSGGWEVGEHTVRAKLARCSWHRCSFRQNVEQSRFVGNVGVCVSVCERNTNKRLVAI